MASAKVEAAVSRQDDEREAAELEFTLLEDSAAPRCDFCGEIKVGTWTGPSGRAYFVLTKHGPAKHAVCDNTVAACGDLHEQISKLRGAADRADARHRDALDTIAATRTELRNVHRVVARLEAKAEPRPSLGYRIASARRELRLGLKRAIGELRARSYTRVEVHTNDRGESCRVTTTVRE